MQQIQYRHTGLKYSICNLYLGGAGVTTAILLEDGSYLLLEDGFYLLQEVAGEDNYLDFTEFTLVDSEANLFVGANTLTITDMYTEHTEAYLYYDFGVGYFSEDFEINFEFTVTDDAHGQDTSDMFGLLAACNVLGCRDDNDAGPWAYWTPGTDGVGTIDIHAGDDSYATSFMKFNNAPGTVFYCTLERISTVAPNDCEVWLSVYSDAARTTLMNTTAGTPSIRFGRDDVPSVNGLTTFRYLEVGLSEKLTYDDTAYGSYTVSNIEIISH